MLERTMNSQRVAAVFRNMQLVTLLQMVEGLADAVAAHVTASQANERA